jgi:predicted transcriptional regulator
VHALTGGLLADKRKQKTKREGNPIMYTPGMMRHAIEELRNLGYTAEQARFIIRNCGTGAGGFSEGNDCAKGKAGKDGDGDGEFEGDKGGGGGKGGKPRQTEGTSEEVSGERAEIQRILDQAPRVAEVQKGIEETKKKIKSLRRSYKKNPDPDKVREEKAEIKKLFALEAEAERLPSPYDVQEAMDWEEETDPLPIGSDGMPGKPLEPLFTDDELAAADKANAKEQEAILKQIRKDAPRALEVQKGIEETKKKIKNLRRSYKKKPDQVKVEEEKAEIKKLLALEAEAEGLPDINDLVEAGVKVEEEKPARPRRQSGKPRKKRSFSHRLMELRKAGLPISVAIRMSREDGDD